MQNKHLAVLLGIAASAALYLFFGVLLGTDDLLNKVVYGVGMCVTAAGIAWRVYPVLAPRRRDPEE